MPLNHISQAFKAGVPILICWALGGIICNFTPILPCFQHWGDEPRPRFFSGEQIKRRPKKKRSLPKVEDFFPRIQVKTKTKKSSSLKMKHFFPRILLETCAEMHIRVKLLGGCRCRPSSNYWGDTVKLLGGIYPPRVSAPLVQSHLKALDFWHLKTFWKN